MTDLSSPSPLKPSSYSVYIFVCFAYILLILCTKPYFWADAPDYVDSVIAYQEGQMYEFWEFGHLLWRPLGWSVWTLFFDKSDPALWRYQIYSTFQAFNYLSGLGSSLLIAYILLRLNVRSKFVVVATLGFICSHAFLNFTQTGTSYITASFFLLLGIAFSISKLSERSYAAAVLSGISLALAVTFWIAFVWVIPAAFFSNVLLKTDKSVRIQRVLITVGSFVVTCGLLYSIALLSLQIGSASELRAWVTTSSHGNTTQGVSRVVFGISRSFIFMKDGGTEVKRYMQDDPYNPVSLSQLIFGAPLWVLLFYLFGLLVVGILSLSKENKAVGWLLIGSILPLSIFAIFFDGAAIERYIPFLGTSFIALGAALNATRSRIILAVLITGLFIVSVVNLHSLSTKKIGEFESSVSYRASLLNGLPKNDHVFLLNWLDDLVNFNRSFPFNENNSGTNRPFSVVVTPGTDQTKFWKQQFSQRARESWEKGDKVWISARAFRATPLLDWNWSEGDDKNVKWQDFKTFFSKLDIGENIGGEDGFVLVVGTDNNMQYLSTYK